MKVVYNYFQFGCWYATSLSKKKTYLPSPIFQMLQRCWFQWQIEGMFIHIMRLPMSSNAKNGHYQVIRITESPEQLPNRYPSREPIYPLSKAGPFLSFLIFRFQSLVFQKNVLTVQPWRIFYVLTDTKFYQSHNGLTMAWTVKPHHGALKPW